LRHYGLHVGYQCLALETDNLLTYVGIIIITTTAVVMPKKSIDNRGTFFMLKIYQKGRGLRGVPKMGVSLKIADRQGPASFLKLL